MASRTSSSVAALALVATLVGTTSAHAASNICEGYFSSSPIAEGKQFRAGFIDPGIGLVHKSDGSVEARIKISRDDVYGDTPLRRQAARFLNALIYPISLKLGAQKLSGPMNRLLNDDRNLPYLTKLADAFELKIKSSPEQIKASVPKEGAAIVIAQHPRAGIDAIAMSALITSARSKPDVLIVMFDHLKEVPGLAANALIVKKKPTQADLLDMRRQTLDHLKKGGLVIILPAGANSDRHANGLGNLVDPGWKAGIYDFAAQFPNAPIVPMFVEGRMSDAYYAAADIDKSRAGKLLPRELAAQIGNTIEVKIGKPVTGQQMITVAKKFAKDQLNGDADENVHDVEMPEGTKYARSVFVAGLRSLVYDLGRQPTAPDANVQTPVELMNHRP